MRVIRQSFQSKVFTVLLDACGCIGLAVGFGDEKTSESWLSQLTWKKESKEGKLINPFNFTFNLRIMNQDTRPNKIIQFSELVKSSLNSIL